MKKPVVTGKMTMLVNHQTEKPVPSGQRGRLMAAITGGTKERRVPMIRRVGYWRSPGAILLSAKIPTQERKNTMDSPARVINNKVTKRMASGSVMKIKKRKTASQAMLAITPDKIKVRLVGMPDWVGNNLKASSTMVLVPKMIPNVQTAVEKTDPVGLFQVASAKEMHRVRRV